jgi:hypothetical protein
MEKLSPKEKVAFYSTRTRKGDNHKLAYITGYSVSHIINVRAGRRTPPTSLAEAMFKLSRRRSINK